MALANDVSDLRLLLTQWDNALKSNTIEDSFATTLRATEADFILKTQETLQELAALTEKLYEKRSDDRLHFQRTLWLRKRSKVLLLKSKISGAIQTLRDLVALHDSHLISTNDATMARVELRQISMHRMLTTLSAPDNTNATTVIQTKSVDADSIIIEGSLSGDCSIHCSCCCHYRYHQRTSSLFDRVLGHLFLGYTGLPRVGAVCDTSSCTASQMTSLRLMYTFPAWCLNATIDAVVGKGPYGNPVLNISMPNRRDYGSENSLFHFAERGMVDDMRRLLRLKLASPYDVTSHHGRTAFRSALRRASRTGDLEPCRLLISHGVKLDTPDDWGCTDMMSISQTFLCTTDRAYADCLSTLVARSNLLQVWDFSSLHEVVLGLRGTNLAYELAQLSHRSHVNKVDNLKRTALHWAARKGNAVAVQELLLSGADYQLADLERHTALHFAARAGSKDCVNMLLQAGADLSARSSRGADSVSIAAGHRHDRSAMIRQLCAAGASPNFRGKRGVSVLQCAATRGNRSNIRTLLDLGADVNVYDDEGDSPLFDAILWNNMDVIDLLLQHCVDLDHANNRGETVLHMLAEFGTVCSLRTIAPYLYQCNPDAKDHNGRTPLDVLAFRMPKDVELEGELRRLIVALTRGDDDGASTDDDDADDFKDAVEVLPRAHA